jgi:hypothetical protein
MNHPILSKPLPWNTRHNELGAVICDSVSYLLSAKMTTRFKLEFWFSSVHHYLLQCCETQHPAKSTESRLSDVLERSRTKCFLY